MQQSGLEIVGTTLTRYTGDKEIVVVPDIVKRIGGFAFYKNTFIKKVVLPQNIEIQQFAFDECCNLETLTEKDEALYIFKVEEKAFQQCKRLKTKIVFTGESIGIDAFLDCESLEVVELPNRIDVLSGAFCGCSKLKRICHEEDTWIAGKIGPYAFLGCNSIQTDIKITENVVRENAFKSCYTIKQILLPSGVEVEKDAFGECRCLKNICHEGDIALLGKIGARAFFNCRSLQSDIKLTAKLVPQSAFLACHSVKFVSVPDKTVLEKSAFAFCDHLVHICEVGKTFEAGELGEEVFWYCDKLITPIRVTGKILPKEVFSKCSSLSEVYLPKDIRMDESAFQDCSAKIIYYESNSLPKDNTDKKTVRNPKRIIPKEEQIQDNIIGFNDFLVRTDIYNCRNQGHKLQEITAVVYCLTRTGEVIEKKVMAGYCQDCKRYYLLNKEFERLRSEYTLLCRVIDNSEPSTNQTGVFADFNKESILKQYGYSVSQARGLSLVQRRTILEFLLAGNILTKTEICAHLDWLIGIRSYDGERFKSAIDKWKDDRRFIENYQLTESREVIVNRITKGRV